MFGNPSYLSFPETISSVAYSEGIFVGYRFYDARTVTVQYPFGFGMTFTMFDYEELTVDAAGAAERAEYDVCVTVRNTGARVESEVVQLYVRDDESRVRTSDHALSTYLRDDRYNGVVRPAYHQVAASCGHHPIVESLVGMPIRLVLQFLPMTSASDASIAGLCEAVSKAMEEQRCRR